MNNFSSYSMDFQDTTLILFFLTNNKCLLVGFIMEGSSYYSLVVIPCTTIIV